MIFLLEKYFILYNTFAFANERKITKMYTLTKKRLYTVRGRSSGQNRRKSKSVGVYF